MSSMIIHGNFTCYGQQSDEVIVHGDALICENSFIKKLTVYGKLEAMNSSFEQLTCKGNAQLTDVQVKDEVHVQGLELTLVNTQTHSITMECYPSWSPAKARIKLKGDSIVHTFIRFTKKKGVVHLFDLASVGSEVCNGCIHLN